jgi:hypothetical protein
MAKGRVCFPSKEVSGSWIRSGVFEAAKAPGYAEAEGQLQRNPPCTVLAPTDAKTTHSPAQSKLVRRWTIPCHDKTPPQLD